MRKKVKFRSLQYKTVYIMHEHEPSFKQIWEEKQ